MCYQITRLNDHLQRINTSEYFAIPTRLEEALNDVGKQDDFHLGNEIMKNIQDDFNTIDTKWKTRSRIQKKIHHAILSGIAPLIYKSSYRTHQKLITRINRFIACLAGNFIRMPRRAGKTEAVAQALAVIVKNVPGVTISVVAPSARQSKGKSGIKALVLDILENALDVHDFNHTDESIFYTPSPGDTRKLYAFPGGSPDTYVYVYIPR